VVRNTPDKPHAAVDPDRQLRTLGVIGSPESAVHKAGIQHDLNDLGWHIRLKDIDSAPTTTVGDCRDSILLNAF
jgi:hypothetical protein